MPIFKSQASEQFFLTTHAVIYNIFVQHYLIGRRPTPHPRGGETVGANNRPTTTTCRFGTAAVDAALNSQASRQRFFTTRVHLRLPTLAWQRFLGASCACL